MKAAISSSSNSILSNHSSIRKWAIKLSFHLKDIGQDILSKLSGETELKIQKIVEKQGVTCWLVYDPITQKKVVLASEAEVRIWIEKRYNNSI